MHNEPDSLLESVLHIIDLFWVEEVNNLHVYVV